jgi:hypothetical protein
MWQGHTSFSLQQAASKVAPLVHTMTSTLRVINSSACLRVSQFFLFFLWYWSLNSEPTPWATLPALFCKFFFFFWDRVLQTICPGWLQTVILLISASWVARITVVSHQCPAEFPSFTIARPIAGGSTRWDSRPPSNTQGTGEEGAEACLPSKAGPGGAHIVSTHIPLAKAWHMGPASGRKLQRCSGTMGPAKPWHSLLKEGENSYIETISWLCQHTWQKKISRHNVIGRSVRDKQGNVS